MKIGKQKCIVGIILLFGVTIFMSLYMLYVMRRKVKPLLWWEIPVVAHACGQIGGRTGTNSKEALEQTALNGYHMIEVDFSLTSDGELVLLHGWDDDTLEGLEIGESGNDRSVPDLETFLNTKICRKYTSMTAKDLVLWMKAHPDIYIMTDVKALDEQSLKKQFQRLAELCDYESKLLNQFVIQVYNVESYDCIMDVYEFNNVLYATYPFATDDIEYWKKVASDCEQRNILVVSVPRQYVSTRKHPVLPYVNILKDSGLLVCTHTINTITEMERMINAGADMIVSDYLLESDMEYIQLE